MPTKKLFFFGLIIFCGFLFFSNINFADAQACTSGQGTCRASCSTGEVVGIADPICDSIEICCVPQTSGTGGGGIGTSQTGVGPFNGTTVGLPGPQGGIAQILSNILIWLLAVFGIIAMIGFVISGIQYVVAAGDESTIESAKRNMTYSIIGVIVGLSGFIIIKAIYSALTATPIF